MRITSQLGESVNLGIRSAEVVEEAIGDRLIAENGVGA
jgi:hypothetical protein